MSGLSPHTKPLPHWTGYQLQPRMVFENLVLHESFTTERRATLLVKNRNQLNSLMMNPKMVRSKPKLNIWRNQPLPRRPPCPTFISRYLLNPPADFDAKTTNTKPIKQSDKPTFIIISKLLLCVLVLNNKQLLKQLQNSIHPLYSHCGKTLIWKVSFPFCAHPLPQI